VSPRQDLSSVFLLLCENHVPLLGLLEALAIEIAFLASASTQWSSMSPLLQAWQQIINQKKRKITDILDAVLKTFLKNYNVNAKYLAYSRHADSKLDKHNN